ncbi:MAG: peptidylprolyl isomerase [Burkholderiaceae bacterium]
MSDLSTIASDTQINHQSFITLHYSIALADGRELASTFSEKPATLQMGSGQLAKGLEDCLLGLRPTDCRTFELPPEAAYGARKVELVQCVARQMLDKHAGPNTTFDVDEFVDFPAPDGRRFAGTVIAVDGDAVTFDFNHPLAGLSLQFKVEIIGVL